MIDYITCLGKYYPTVFASCVGDSTVYSNLLWESGDDIPAKTVLDNKIFEDLQNSAIAALSTICGNIITAGFISSALGSTYMYDSEDVDQINLIGATTTVGPTAANPDGTSMWYAVRPVVDGITEAKTYMLHTYAQLRQVMDDGANYKLGLLMNFNTKRYYIGIATTPDEVSAITWSSNP